jgi:ferritin-like metal-binding protein YciE
MTLSVCAGRIKLEGAESQDGGGMSNQLRRVEDFLRTAMREMFRAEQLLLESLKQWHKSAQSRTMRDLIDAHIKNTNDHIERIEQAFECLNENPTGKKCDVFEALLQKTTDTLERNKGSKLLDAVLVMGLMGLSHHKMAHYKLMAVWARKLELQEIGDVLDENYDVEEESEVVWVEFATKQISDHLVHVK